MPYVPSRLDEGHGLSLAGGRRGRAAGVARHRHRRLRDRRAWPRSPRRTRAGSTSSSPTTTASRRCCPPALAIVNPHRADATYPDRRLAGSGVAFKLAQLLLADEPGGPAAALDLADLATIGTVADVAPILGENRAIARLGLERLATRAAARASRRCSSARRIDAGRRRPRDPRVRHRAAAQRRRPGGGGARGRPAAARRRRRPRPRAHADALEAANRDPARPDEDGRRRGARGRRRTAIRRRGRDDRPRAVAGRDRRPRRVAAGRGARPAGGRRRRPRRRRPGLVPERRRARPRRDARARARDLFIRHGGHAGAAGFEIADRALGRVPRAVPRARRGRGAAGSAARRSPIDLALPAARRRLRACTATSPRLAPCGPGNPEPLVAVLGLTVTRVRAGDRRPHASSTLRRDRDVLDGIAFGRPDIAETVHEGDGVDVVARLDEPHVRRLRVAPARDPRRGDRRAATRRRAAILRRPRSSRRRALAGSAP